MKKLYQKHFSKSALSTIFQKKIVDSKSIGRDGITVSNIENNLDPELDLIIRKIKYKTYSFTKYKPMLISKGAGKPPRELSIPTVRDKITLRALCEYLFDVFPDSKVNKPHEFIKRIKEVINSIGINFVFLRIDVKNFYPTIDRKILMKDIKDKIDDKRIINLINRAINNETNNKNLCGIPQGLSISNILSAIYMSDIDDKWKSKIIFGGGKEIFSGIDRYFRYVDDVLIICDSLEQAELIYREFSNDLFSLKKLECHPLSDGGKSCIVPADIGVEYLGFTISKKNERKISISIRKSSYDRMFVTLLSVINSLKDGSQERKLLWRLNLKISGCRFNGVNYGWLHFFAQTENKSQLKYLDLFIEKQLKRMRKEHMKSSVKRFVKAYHEIRHNSLETKYIPDFDKSMTREEMEDYIMMMESKLRSNYKDMSDNDVSILYYKILKPEILKLEKDILEIFS